MSASSQLNATVPSVGSHTARAGNRRIWLLSALHVHTKPPYKTDLHKKTLRLLNRPGRVRTAREAAQQRALPAAAASCDQQRVA